MMRKLYLSLTLDDGLQPDSYECLRFMQRDWARDAGDKGHAALTLTVTVTLTLTLTLTLTQTQTLTITQTQKNGRAHV